MNNLEEIEIEKFSNIIFERVKQYKIDYFISSDLFDNAELIRNSLGVFTLSGSVSLEAVALGVNSFVIGDSIFEGIEGIIKVNLDNINVDPCSINADKFEKSLAYLYEKSQIGNTGKLFSGDVEECNKFCQSLYNKFKI